MSISTRNLAALAVMTALTTVNPLPKSQRIYTSRTPTRTRPVTRTQEKEMARRRRQIAKGTLNESNGLVRS